MSLPDSRARQWILALLLTIPLIIGAVVAAVGGLDPLRSWTSAAEPAGAPAAAGPTGIDPTELVDARRAAGEAASQAGFLTTGTGELLDGTGQLQEGATTLPDQFSEAVSGAQLLSNGMVELQAGVGQLGTGAVEVADGVGTAVDQVVGFGAMRGQLIEAIDYSISELEAAEDVSGETVDPRLVEAREALVDLRGQAELIDIDGELTAQLTDLKDGSRELANQLSVPGYSFHDGVYTATKAAQDLSYGLSQSQPGIDDAVEGASSLDEGAARIDAMATQTQDRIDAIQRALPVVQVADTDGQSEEESLGSVLSPIYAMLIAAIVMLGGAATGMALYQRRAHGWWLLTGAVVGLSTLGVMLLAIVSTGFSLQLAAGSALVLALSVLAAAALTRATLRLFGPVAGSIVVAVGSLIQVGVVGWVWKSAASTNVSVLWQILANLSPLNWATSALTVLGNQGTAQALWLALAVLGSLSVIGIVAAVLGNKKAEEVVAA
ncbi:YhgE/Pip domain-containing protein [Corynebacterium alimapuense]|uniref:Phage infection protein n=1 Tax=Corynebacterium alimapuense TaxID=1576874 RepID=A0A3M8K798_9CORY|nr:YhgE/Pip domain-containing protein [Corynebacterium alimapuense]RNE49026.1 hypothetical protein C5L39_07025 [Corynebacterium alimapuense]